MPKESLPRCKPLFEAGNGRRMVQVSHSITTVGSIKDLTRELTCFDVVRLPGWGPGDPPRPCLETTGDMTVPRSCIRKLSSIQFLNFLFCSRSFIIPVFLLEQMMLRDCNENQSTLVQGYWSFKMKLCVFTCDSLIRFNSRFFKSVTHHTSTPLSMEHFTIDILFDCDSADENFAGDPRRIPPTLN